jgi:2,4-dienoyl-CoA reductase (NADPH2)
MYAQLFSPLTVGGRKLSNRIVMAPLYLGYAGEGGTVTPMLLEHYRLMADSGAAMITVENAAVDFEKGRGSKRTIRIDTDENLDGLARLADCIKQEGALACIQINHAGRFAGVKDPVAPSAVETFGITARALSIEETAEIREKFVSAAERARKAGFDMVELHGATGYLLAQFVSPHTNKRNDEYGGSLEKRMRFPLEVVDAVRSAVGDFPIGYRFLADEFLPGGLKPAESRNVAAALSEAGVAYLSVMGGTYESFTKPEIVERSRTQGYMAGLARDVRKHVDTPVVTAGRISSGRCAEAILEEGKADLVGLARVLWADPEWPKKVREGREEEIIHCDPECEEVCMQLVMKGKPAYCVQWPPEKTRRFKDLFE